MFKRIYNKVQAILLRKKRSDYISTDTTRGVSVVIMGNTYVNNNSTIGGYTYIGFNCFISGARIGRYCSIANNVSIGMGEHDLGRISTSSLFYDEPLKILLAKDCIIGNDVWIGVDSIIRRGVAIGDGAIIGANSFVNTDIPAYAIAVGSPAKIIKYRFETQQIDAIEKSAWWSYDLEDAKIEVRGLEDDFKINI